ncbi:MAG: sigma-54 dependent transcriptional regulator [Myxococcales bacterium]
MHSRSTDDDARPRATVLVVDDDSNVRELLWARLRRAGFSVQVAAHGAEARRLLDGGTFELVVLDYELPDTNGLVLLQEVRGRHPEVPVIMLTGHATVDRAVGSMSAGAAHFLSKPVDFEALLSQIDRVLAPGRAATGSPRDTGPPMDTGSSGVDRSPSPLIVRSVTMLRVRAVLEKLGRTPAPTLLLTGESGVGKDSAARFVHAVSSRADAPFVNITCSALPDQLLESELFGHERGAFTDARQRKKGLVEEAEGGTVFLDEIGEISPSVQVKLLRFLEERTFRRVGGSAELRADVRVVAATNRDLRKAVQDGDFRKDLYYRLAVLHVAIPPLRERTEDIPVLAEHFAARFAALYRSRARSLSGAALEALQRHPWPGNVRELKNVIERAVLMTEGPELAVEDLLFEPLPDPGVDGGRLLELPPEGLSLDALEHELLQQALQRTGGNKTRAATLLGLTRDQIRHRIEKHGLEGP